MSLHLTRLPSLATAILAVVVLILLLLPGCSMGPPTAEGVQLVLNPEVLEPTTTFELRFERAVVAAEQVGHPAEPSPLVITPALRGRFVWLSERSGVFTPTAPLALDTAYRFRLRHGLTEADGRRSAARLDRVLRTPSLLVVDHPMREQAGTNQSATPWIRLDFNAGVKATGAGRWMAFRSRDAGIVPARVAQASRFAWEAEALWWPPPAPAWSEAFPTAGQHVSVRAERPLPRGPGVNPEILNALLITAARPLPAGHGWELVVARGLPSTERGVRLAGEFRLPLGDVQPFAVAAVEAQNTRSIGRWLAITFTKPLAPEWNPTNLADWIAVSPAPTNLTFVPNGNRLIASGDFALATNYTVTMRRGLTAREPFTLAADHTAVVRFAPMPPRLYFPEFSTEQLAGGRREFPLAFMNTGTVKVRAKAFDRHTLVHALRGYRSYYRSWEERDDPDEAYQEIAFNLVPGRTIFEADYPLTNAVDEGGEITLGWDEILGAGGHGAVFLEATTTWNAAGLSKRTGTEALVQVTDLGLVWKQAPGAVLVEVFSYASGQPLPGVTVRLLTRENEMVAEAVTDAAGLARLHPTGEAAFVMAETADDLRAAALDEGGIPSYGFGLPMAWQRDTNTLQVLLFSDRPVYRRGETAHLKAIAREWRDGEFAVPGGETVTLRAINAQGQTFLETNLVFGPLGSLEFRLVLPPVSLGDYRVELRRADRSEVVVGQHDFRVEEYRPNAFEVTLKAPPEVPAGETPAVTVNARYLLGQPLTKARVEWSLRAMDEDFAPAGFDRFVFCGDLWSPELDRSPGSLTLEGQVDYTAGLVLKPEVTMNARAPHPRRCELLAEVTDVNQQTVSSPAGFLVHSSALYLGLTPPPVGLRAGAAMPVIAVAVSATGQPWPQPVRAVARLRRLEWRSVRVASAGGAVSYRNELEQHEVAQAEIETAAVVKRDGRWEAVAPAPPVSFTPPQAGYYLLEATAKDGGGRDVITATEFYVPGTEALGWNYRNEVQAELVPDRTNYVVGDTATLVVKTPISGAALVTVERDGVRRAFVTNLVGNAPALSVPILPGDAPNVFVSVVLVRGAADSTRESKMPEYRVGYCQLNVARPDARLLVELHPDVADHRPGETVRVAAVVADATGRPVPAAEVTVFAVDEGVLSLTGFAAPDPYGFFFAPRPLAVTSGITLTQLMPEDPAELRFQNKGFLVGGGGLARMRQNFVALAFWNAGLMTGAAGRVNFEFTAPDNLTRYRLVAVVHTARSQFGNAEAAVRINKPLMIEPALPRFANVGDRLLARAVVLNRTDAAGEVEVSLTLDAQAKLDTNGAPAAALVGRVTVPAQGVGWLDVPVECVAAGSAKWVWRARFVGGAAAADPDTASFMDSVQSTLEVGYAAPRLREVLLARVAGGETNLLAHANPQLLEGHGTATVRVANTRLGNLNEAAGYLLAYPYGCVEQTGSKLLPLLVLRSQPAFLPGATNVELIERQVREGVFQLLAMQTPAGGLAYWPHGSEPTLWGSAYGGIALAMARRQGVPVPSPSPDALAAYLRKELAGTADVRDGLVLSDHCLALCALGLLGKPEPAYHEALFARRAELSGEAASRRLRPKVRRDGPTEMVAGLLAPRSEPGSAERGGRFGNAASELGARLLAWVRFRPQDPAVDVLVSELFAANENGRWPTTQGNAWALLALAEYAQRVEARRAEGAAKVEWGEEKSEFAFPSTPAAHERAFAVAPERANQPLTLRSAASGPLFAQASLEAQTSVARPPRQDRGYSIQRAYARLDEKNQPQPVTGLRVGDRVLVTLTLVVRQTAHYVAVDDALPALFEAINPEFKSQATAGADLAEDWVSDHRELRTDRALFFSNDLAPGRYTIRYLTRVRAAGTVTAPPAKVEEMYHPERFGLSGTEVISAAPMD